LFKTWGAKPKKQTDFVETDPRLCWISYGFYQNTNPCASSKPFILIRPLFRSTVSELCSLASQRHRRQV
jgi:hypothetical protein